MSDLELVTLVVVATWLAILSFVVLLLVRQLGLVTVRLDQAADLATPRLDGIEVGKSIPVEARRHIAGIDSTAVGATYVLLLSGSCPPCHEMISELADFELRPNVVALLTGNEEASRDLALRVPTWMKPMKGDPANDIARALEVDTTPFIFEFNGDRVVGKALLRNAGDFATFTREEERGAGEETNGRVAVEVTR